ncbi:conjugal transfer protein TraF [Candidatus Dependentiae bacterium]|nr:conjugal transfer protein TraF [Candidatus Dependentiae bacterium]
MRFKNISIYAATTNVAFVNATLDTVIAELGTNDIKPGTNSVISGYGSVIGEVGLSYGFNCGKLSESLKQLDLGLTVKGVGGINKAVTKQLKNFDDFAEDDLEVDDISLDNVEISCDLGLKYNSKDDKFSIGIVGKNLTGPTVDSSDETNGLKVEIDPMVRLGICWKPFKRITFAADLDLTENEIAVFNNLKYKSQQFGAGLEIRPFNWKRFDLPIRVGYSTNIAESGASNLITGGIGLKLAFLKVDISGGIDDGLDYKEREKFGNLNISLFW